MTDTNTYTDAKSHNTEAYTYTHARERASARICGLFNAIAIFAEEQQRYDLTHQWKN